MNTKKLFTVEEIVANQEKMMTTMKIALEDAGSSVDKLFENAASCNAANVLKNDFCKLRHSTQALKNGIMGEKIAANALKIVGEDMIVLTNVRTPFNDERYFQQHDFVIICSKGIFTAEAKNVYANTITISETGFMYYNNDFSKAKNIARQSNWHTVSLKRYLADNGYSGLPVIPMFIFTNPKAVVDNRFVDRFTKKPRILDVYPNTLKDAFQQDLPDVLTLEQMKDIERLLNEASAAYPEQKKYPLTVDADEFCSHIEDAIDVLSPKPAHRSSNDKRLFLRRACIYLTAVLFTAMDEK